MEELLNRYFLNVLSDEEKIVLFEKIDADSALKKQFITLQNNYALSQMIKDKHDVEYAQKGWAKLQHRTKRIVIWKNIFSLSKYAAILLIAAGLFAIIKQYIPDSNKEVQYTEHIAPTGLRKNIVLPDGTKVCLAPSSRLKAPTKFAENKRLVELNGEALFEVEKNKDKPFIVKTGKYDIRVLGTVFSVTAYANTASFKTSLKEGAVSIYNDAETLILKAGESALLKNNRLTIITNCQNEIYFLQSGLYQFDNRPLGEVLNMLGNWYGVDIQISNKKLAQSLLTGKFRENDDIEIILNAIQQIYPFTYQKSFDNAIEVY
jgi:ferric-dicitrate binding protein FerR (iron transport regulator)